MIGKDSADGMPSYIACRATACKPISTNWCPATNSDGWWAALREDYPWVEEPWSPWPRCS